MTITHQDELMRIGRIVANAMHAMAAAMAPGIKTREFDAIGQEFLEREGALSAPQTTHDFPDATFGLGSIQPSLERLCRDCSRAMQIGIAQVERGNRRCGAAFQKLTLAKLRII